MNKMIFEMLLGFAGGLGFFLFGMRLLSQGLRGVAGDRLKRILALFTKTPVVGILAGAGLTAFVQSSSAISVLLVGFVNASLLTLRQALGIILGMNIGTTVTAWFISVIAVFRISTYALPAVGIGFALNVLCRSRTSKMWGQAVLGFGMLFVGLGIMGDVFSPLQESERVVAVFSSFSRYPILGVLAGAAATVLLQSSSASIALVQMLAFTGVISFPAAVPLILGDNIGTTATAMLASAGTNVAARRVARAHLIFNLVGVCYMLVFLYNGMYLRFIEFIIPGEISQRNIMVYIALAHTVFNLANALLFLPFLGIFERLVTRTVKSRPDEICPAPRYLEEHLLESPPLAFEQAGREISRMIEIARGALAKAVNGFFDNDRGELAKVAPMEEAVDNLQKEITRYVIALSRKNLSDEESQEIPVLIHSVNDIERVGDHAENIFELAGRKIDQKLVFSKEAIAELKYMYKETDDMITDVLDALKDKDVNSAKRALKREDALNRMQMEFRQTHVERLDAGRCNLMSGLLFLDFVDNLEKIGDHLTNIAQSVIGGLRWDRRV